MHLPPQLLAHWASLIRRCPPRIAHQHLLRHLRAWRADSAVERIPGYLAPPADAPGTGLPRGWSLSELQQATRQWFRPSQRPIPDLVA